MQKLKIDGVGNLFGTKIYIDDKEMKSVRSYKLSQTAGDVAQIDICFQGEPDIEGYCQVNELKYNSKPTKKEKTISKMNFVVEVEIDQEKYDKTMAELKALSELAKDVKKNLPRKKWWRK